MILRQKIRQIIGGTNCWKRLSEFSIGHMCPDKRIHLSGFIFKHK